MEDSSYGDPYESTVASLTPWPLPDPTEAPTPVPSAKLHSTMGTKKKLKPKKKPPKKKKPRPSKTPSPTPGPTDEPTDESDTDETTTDSEDEYDGPAKTGKTLKDLALDLGAPESLGAVLDDMQEAIIGIVNDLVNNDGTRTSFGDIIGHENRLRGIGALMVLAALIGLALDTTVGESLRE